MKRRSCGTDCFHGNRVYGGYLSDELCPRCHPWRVAWARFVGWLREWSL